MKERPDDEILENLYYRQLQLSEQLKPLLSLYFQDTFQKGEPRDYTRLKTMVVWYFEQKIREKHVSLGERHPAKPASGAAAAKGKNKGNKTEKH